MLRHYVQHYSGNKIYLDDFTDNVYPINDIAHSLAAQNRYNGHSLLPYSIAQHAVMCSHRVPANMALEMLHHDDVEYIISDVVRPIKKQFPGIEEFENKLLEDMYKKAGYQWPIPDEVWTVDNRMLHTEALQLMPNCDISKWGLEDYPPYDIVLLNNAIKPWRFEHAKQMYLDRHNFLVTRRAMHKDGLVDDTEKTYALG